MSLPPLNPNKTAAGIILDPRTLERVVPQSKRKDGTLRKEQKIRPGFTPQEDVGRFRSARQVGSETLQSFVPGTNRVRPPPPKEENPFSQPGASKTKAQLKNEKRREKKRGELGMGHGAGAGGGKAWDESDEEEESGGLKEEFEEADRRLAEDRIVQREKEKERGGETDFPSLTNGASHGPAKSSLDRADSASESSTQLEDQKTKSPSAILPTSPPISNTIPSPPLIASETQLDKTEQPWRNKRPPSSASPATKAIETSGRSGPLHPIQGGRNGPIGLANPPLPGPEPDAVPVHEPRVRKEIRVREGGGNDMSSLASRVKNLVIDNQKGGSPRVRKAQSEKT